MAQPLHVSAASRVEFGPPISANRAGTPLPEAPWGSWLGIRKPTSSQRAPWRPNFGPGRCLYFFSFQAVALEGQNSTHPAWWGRGGRARRPFGGRAGGGGGGAPRRSQWLQTPDQRCPPWPGGPAACRFEGTAGSMMAVRPSTRWPPARRPARAERGCHVGRDDAPANLKGQLCRRDRCGTWPAFRSGL